MRQITVSTEVFAEIWRRHKPGQDAEDDILRAELKLPARKKESQSVSADEGGFTDHKFNVTVSKGFEIFRIYKGREYRALASGGKWVLSSNNISYLSLNKLSRAVTNGPENAWVNWKFRDKSGTEKLIDTLRSSDKVASRGER